MTNREPLSCLDEYGFDPYADQTDPIKPAHSKCDKTECINGYPSVLCVNCGLKYRNYDSIKPAPIQTEYDRLMQGMTVEKMARKRIFYDGTGYWYDSMGRTYESAKQALQAEIAWLNKPVEEKE